MDNIRSISWCAQLFIPRSGTHPLDIIIDLPLFESMGEIMELLEPHCSRWRKLRIRGGRKARPTPSTTSYITFRLLFYRFLIPSLNMQANP